MQATLDSLKQAIDQNDLPLVQSLMLQNPALHRAPLGYGKDGPLTWVAECRYAAPDPTRLAMAAWMIENGSDVHQGGDGPLMRAALNRARIPMMELLVSHGADVNAAWHNSYQIIYGPCETLNPDSLRWLLDHGADPNCSSATALDYLVGTYVREPERLSACIDILLNAGGKSKHQVPAVFAVIRYRLEELTDLLNVDSALVRQRFPYLDFGTTAARMLTLRGTTLLHVAAEFGNLHAAKLLLDRGADVNAAADVDENGVGGQTAIFHAATQPHDGGLSIVQFLVERGANLKVRAKLPGHYEAPGEVLECTPLEYALRFPGDQGPTSVFLGSAASLNAD